MRERKATDLFRLATVHPERRHMIYYFELVRTQNPDSVHLEYCSQRARVA